MSESSGLASWLRRRKHALYVSALVLLVAAGIAAVIVWDPLLALVSALPLPDLPDLSDLPGWVKWLKNAVVIVLVLLGVLGAFEKHGPGRGRDRAQDE